MDTDDNTFSYVKSENGATLDQHETYLEENKEYITTLLEGEKICELCKQICTHGFTPVKGLESVLTCSLSIPEINFSSAKEPVICSSCFDSLNTNMYADTKDDDSLSIKMEEIEMKTEEDEIGNKPGGDDELCQDEASEDHQTMQESLSDEHQQTHENNPKTQFYTCNKCVFKTKLKNSIRRHLLSHKENKAVKTYRCDACTFQTNMRRCLVSHRLEHIDESKVKIFSCEACTYKTKLKSSLKRHQLTHKGEQMLHCDQCAINGEPNVKTDPSHDIVLCLIETPFYRRTETEKQRILNCRPMPKLTATIRESRRGRETWRTFQTSWYDNYQWLCGSLLKESLYCWPCILLGNSTNAWCSPDGFRDVKNFSRSSKMHEGTKEHIKNFLALTRLQQTRATVDDALKEDAGLNKILYNENVRKNRLLICYLTDVTIMLGKRELAFQDRDEMLNSPNRGSFKEIFECLTKRNYELTEHCLKFNNIFTGQFNAIENELIFCIHEYLIDFIKNEVNDKACLFFGVIVDDATDTTERSQCSITLRYVTNGRLQERFIGFFDVSESRSADVVRELLVNVLEGFNFKEKLVAQCYDGASVMPAELSELGARIKSYAPLALFTHCCAHKLCVVFEQGARQIDKSRIFFSTLLSIPSYFHQSPKRAFVLDEILGEGIPQSVNARWCTRSKILRLVADERDDLILAFETIINDKTSGLESVNAAKGFLKHFQDFEFTILTRIYREVFTCTDLLYQILQANHLDLNHCSKQIEITGQKICDLRNEEIFKKFFNYAKNVTGLPSERGKSRDESEVFSSYKALYYEILDCILLQLSTRFGYLYNLNFLGLADSSKFQQYTSTFPEESFECLLQMYPNVFETDRLRNELTILYRDEQFSNLDVQKMVETLYKEYKMIFSETYKLFCLVLTIPATNVSVERNFSCFNRIKTYLRNRMTKEGLMSSAIMAIEKELLQSVSADPQFYEDIINKFANLKDRPIDLIYKK